MQLSSILHTTAELTAGQLAHSDQAQLQRPNPPSPNAHLPPFPTLEQRHFLGRHARIRACFGTGYTLCGSRRRAVCIGCCIACWCCIFVGIEGYDNVDAVPPAFAL